MKLLLVQLNCHLDIRVGASESAAALRSFKWETG